MFHSPDGATVIVVLQHFCSPACHTFFHHVNYTMQGRCVSMVMVNWSWS